MPGPALQSLKPLSVLQAGNRMAGKWSSRKGLGGAGWTGVGEHEPKRPMASWPFSAAVWLAALWQ